MQGVQCTRAQRCGGPKFARRCFFSFLGEEGVLLEYLHAGPLQPCYATDLGRLNSYLATTAIWYRSNLDRNSKPKFSYLCHMPGYNLAYAIVPIYTDDGWPSSAPFNPYDFLEFYLINCKFGTMGKAHEFHLLCKSGRNRTRGTWVLERWNSSHCFLWQNRPFFVDEVHSPVYDATLMACRFLVLLA